MSLTHLQVRSGYSFLTSAIQIDPLVLKAKKHGFSALALTDKDVLYGTIPFYEACLKEDIKPLLGMVTTLKSNEEVARVSLLAKDNQGYQQLIKLSSKLKVEEKTVIDLDDIEEKLSGIICILHSNNKPFVHRLEEEQFADAHRYTEAFSTSFLDGDFYVGITQEHVSVGMKSFHDQFQLKAVALTDVRYLNETEVDAYRGLRAIAKGESIKNIPQPKMNHAFMSKQVLKELYSPWPALLESVEEIVERCNVSLTFNKTILPTYPVPEGHDSATYLRHLCENVLTEKYKSDMSLAKQRLSEELKVIQKMNFNDYFLIVWDFVRFAKENDIVVGPGRGSAAGSIVAYLLDITNVDPMRYNLLFERFLNEKRGTMPDIDIDFSDERRDEVIKYVGKKYGKSRVAQIGTFGTFGKLSTIRELVKAFAINDRDAAYLIKQMSESKKETVREVIEESTELAHYVKQSADLQALLNVATLIEGLPRYISTHAAGIVMSDGVLTEEVPLDRGSDVTELNLTQYAMESLEKLGLLKIDLLGLRNLTFLERVLERINYGKQDKLKTAQIVDQDEKTMAVLQAGKTTGVFQLESLGMRRVLRDLQPKSFEDIVAVNALYRPGPMDFIETYIKRKEGLEEVSYIHPVAEPILQSTYGILIYQEQIIQMIHKITGLSFGEADIMRRNFLGKDSEESRRTFVQKAQENGYFRSEANKLSTWLMQSSNYGFNRSHAVSYSKITYWLAYLKAHFPAYFFAELLNQAYQQTKKINEYIQEAKSFSINVLAPSINQSLFGHRVERGHIRLGFTLIKGIGRQDVQLILDERRQGGAFSSLFDFCLRLAPKGLKKEVIERLILVGAFDELLNNRNRLMHSLDRALSESELFLEFMTDESDLSKSIRLTEEYAHVEDFSQTKKLQDEKEYLGIFISSHPLEADRALLKNNNYKTLDEVRKSKMKQKVSFACLIDHIRVIRTKRGESMAFMEVSDEIGSMTVVVFPNVYRTISLWLEEERFIFVDGKLEERRDEKQVIADVIEPYEQVSDESKQVFLKVSEANANDVLNKLKQLAHEHSGVSEVIIHNKDTKQTYKLSKSYHLQLNPLSMRRLQHIFSKDNIVIRKN